MRVNTELVQTDVMVFGKDGKFVDGLRFEQFELRVDGKPHEISFFERVASGSRNEEAQLAAARGAGNSNPTSAVAIPLDRGRTVFFYLDDVHLSASSMSQARALLKRFIDREMGQNDLAAIVSATGQPGFLQQLTDNKAVLRAAIERLTVRPASSHDAERPPMTEYQAILVEQNDSDVIDFFVDVLLRDNPGLPRQIAGDMVRQRASAIAQQTAHFTTQSLAALEGVVRSAAPLPGRKLLFLISDGFFLDSGNSDSLDRMRAISSSAARSGVVIYSIDARGLMVSANDLAGGAPADPTGRLQRAAMGEINASQDGLNALARDTGGRAIFNTNALSNAVTAALRETSVYYLLAWRPENEEQRVKYKHIEVTIIGRAELAVRVRRNFSQTEGVETGRTNRNRDSATPRTANDDLRDALGAMYPKRAFPVSLALHFLNLPDAGTVIGASMKVPAGTEAFSAVNGKPTAFIDLAGVVYDDQGKPASSFSDHLTITANSQDARSKSPDSLVYNYRATLKPGLYQVRVAARDQKTGRTGSAMGWIEVPDLAAHHLALSSIIASERRSAGESIASTSDDKTGTAKQVGALSPAILNVEHHFARSSRLAFLIFTYNAASEGFPNVTIADPSAPSKKAAPDLAVQVQLIRDNEPVITTPLKKIETEGTTDLTRLPYAAEIPLQALSAGRYLLKVTVIDRIAKTSASQQLDFQID